MLAVKVMWSTAEILCMDTTGWHYILILKPFLPYRQWDLQSLSLSLHHYCYYQLRLLRMPRLNQFVVTVPDMKVRGQLACPRIKQKHRKKSCELYICLFVHTISRSHDVYLYKSVKTSSCERRAVRVKYELLGQTTCYWWAKTNITRWEECASMGRTQSLLRMRPRGMYSRCAVEDSCSSMYWCI
jgi:hypothetical protein